MKQLATTPEPPYYAVIFSSLLSGDTDGYADTAGRMLELASEQEGFLGVESARDGLGITVSYWRDLASIERWKHHADHRMAKKEGRTRWYAGYRLRIARVEVDIEF